MQLDTRQLAATTIDTVESFYKPTRQYGLRAKRAPSRGHAGIMTRVLATDDLLGQDSRVKKGQ